MYALYQVRGGREKWRKGRGMAKDRELVERVREFSRKEARKKGSCVTWLVELVINWIVIHIFDVSTL